MATISLLSQLVNGVQRQVNLSTNILWVQDIQLNNSSGYTLAGTTSGNAGSSLIGDDASYTNFTPTGATVKGALSGIDTAIGAAGASGANKALSNLASVAINTSLLPGVTASINLGSASFIWETIWASALAYPSGPGLSLQSGYTTDSSGAHSLDWVNRLLVDSGSTTQMSWSTSGVEFNQLTPSTVPYLNAGSILTSSAVTPTELGYVHGVTSSIQTQFANYLPLAGGTMSGAINLGGFAPTNSTTPVNPNDLVNKSYVDNFINATSWKTAALVATTANITLSGEQTIDGILTSSSIVLVKNQSTASQNGIYVSGSGAWARAADMATWAQVPAAAIFVQSGTVNADLGFVCVSQPGGTIGTTAINFVQFSSAGAYMADNVTLQLISGVFSIKSAGVTETQIASSALLSTGGLTGGSGTKIAVNVDGATLDINGSNQVEIKALGVGTAQLAAASVTAAKLGTITDGVTLDQSGAGSTLEVKAAGISATQLATGAFDQTTILGGAGTPAHVAQAPSIKRVLVAGQTFTANTSYAVRWGLTANGETAGRVYAADITTSSHDLFYVIGMASSGTTISAGGNITVTTVGSFNLSSADTAFASGTDGAPVFLTASGTFSLTAPSTSGQAVTRIGMLQVQSATAANNIVDVDPVPVGVN